MSEIIKYLHHGVNVSVDENLLGRHREHCLCFQCGAFKPNLAGNCEMAQRLYELCREFAMITPVYGCHGFIVGEPDFQALGEDQ